MRIVLILMLLVSLAHAGDREEARREFTAGQAADKQKDWQTAIEHYLRAHELMPHPFALYNIAVDYERLGQLREAATWYQRYLDAAPSSPDRAKVAQVLADLKTRPAKLSVRSVPDGARVLLDGVPVGVTPYAGVARGGAHRVAVERAGQREERDLVIEFAEPADLVFTLRGEPGTLMVAGAPAGGLVMIDGEAVGAMPVTVPVAPGPHLVRVTAPGFSPFEAQPVVAPGQTVQVAANLPRSLGEISTPGPTLKIGYLFEAAGGVDIGGSGGVGFGGFGARISRYEGVAHIGRVAGTVAIDFMARWAFFDRVVSPFVGIGYAYSGTSFGYSAQAGLRWDVVRGDRLGVSLLAHIAVRTYVKTDVATSMTTAGVAWPVGLSAELVVFP